MTTTASMRLSVSLQGIASQIEDALADVAGHSVPWVLVLSADDVSQYVSNADRASGVALIEALLARWKANRADIPAHMNPDLAKSGAPGEPLADAARAALDVLQRDRGKQARLRAIERLQKALATSEASAGPPVAAASQRASLAKKVLALPRFSFLLLNGGVRKVPDSVGAWVERDAVIALLEAQDHG